MTDWEQATDPVPVRREKSFVLPRSRNLSKAGKKGGAKMKIKARERVMKDALAVDFSKPYRPKGA